MYNFLVKNGQALAFLTGAAITILSLIIIFSGMESFNMLGDENKTDTTIFNFGLGSAIAMAVIAFIVWLLFSVFQIATNLKGSMKGLIGGAVLILLFVIAYSTASVETSGPVYDAMINQNVSEGNSKFISGGIFTALVLGALAFASFIILEVINFFK